MTFNINYIKQNNNDLFKELKKNREFNVENIQNYVPLYNLFFEINNII